MEAACSSEKVVFDQKTTRRKNPDDDLNFKKESTNKLHD
jgi:hypothetical protein